MAASRLVTLDIVGTEPGGDGAACGVVAGRPVRVDFAIPGERVEARVVEGANGTLTGEVVRVVRASPHRVVPACRYFGPCGGCSWQHIAYPEQLRLKQGLVRQLLEAALGASAPAVNLTLPTPHDGSPAPWGFRNKVHFVFAPSGTPGLHANAAAALGTWRPGRRRGKRLVMGHYRRQSLSVLAVDDCPVHDPAGNRLAFAIRDGLERARIEAAVPGAVSEGAPGIVRHVIVRATLSPAEVLATLVVTRNDKSLRRAVRPVVERAAPDGVHVNVNTRPGPYLFGRETRRVHGRERVRETVAGATFLISPLAFFQTNVRAAEILVDLVLRHAAPARSALDLYAGAGLFSIPLAQRGVRVVAVEENAVAIADGEASRDFNRIARAACRFVRARAEELAAGRVPHLLETKPDLVVLDPPRWGCPPAVLSWICSTLRPARIIYVSCNPEALARDLERVLGDGYRAELIQPIDMFPHTAHIETVAVLEARTPARVSDSRRRAVRRSR